MVYAPFGGSLTGTYPIKSLNEVFPSIYSKRNENYSNLWKPTSNCEVIDNYAEAKSTAYLKQFPRIGYIFNTHEYPNPKEKSVFQNHIINVLEAIWSLLNKEPFFLVRQLNGDPQRMICARSIFLEDKWVIINVHKDPVVSVQLSTEECRELYSSHVGIGSDDYLYLDTKDNPDASKKMWERYVNSLPQKFLDDYVTSIVNDVRIK